MTSSPLDVLGPFRGPCAFCGFTDARHRLADALVEQAVTSDVETVADDYVGYATAETIASLVETVQRNRRRHKARWA